MKYDKIYRRNIMKELKNTNNELYEFINMNPDDFYDWFSRDYERKQKNNKEEDDVKLVT